VTTSRRTLRATGNQPVTFVELFFDLVFVFAVTQVTALTAHDLNPGGVLRSLLLFWLIWWAWTQFTWTLNPADTTHSSVRLITLLATGAAFIMATAVPHAFAGDGLWFAVPYLAVRALGLGLQVRVDIESPNSDHAGVRRWASTSVLGLVLVLAGAVADPSIRSWLWVLAIGADLLAAGIAGKATAWDLSPAHVAERHGLFVIIAIGESLIVAGTAVAAKERTIPLVTVAIAALVVACLMWWSYFGWLKDALEHRLAHAAAADLGQLTRDAYSVAHFPLICGIIGFAVAIEEIVAHPDEPAGSAVVAALGVGICLFVGSAALSWWRLSGRILVPRLAVLVVVVAILVVIAPLHPVWPLATVAAGLVAIIVLEAVRPNPAEATGG
jgi:low temperature requirement protein LtrA